MDNNGNQNGKKNVEKVMGIDIPDVKELKELLKKYLYYVCYSCVYYGEFIKDEGIQNRRKEGKELESEIQQLKEEIEELEKSNDEELKQKSNLKKELGEELKQKRNLKRELDKEEDTYRNKELDTYKFLDKIKDIYKDDGWHEYLEENKDKFPKKGILGKHIDCQVGSNDFKIYVPKGVQSIAADTCYIHIGRYNIVMHEKKDATNFGFDGFTFKFHEINNPNLKKHVEENFTSEFVKNNYISFDELFKDDVASNAKIQNFFKAYFKVYDDHLLTESIIYLEKNRNLILHGAPGTGKTHLSKEIAKRIINLTEKKDGKSVTVQFHPSYDYTDFIEGLRPVQNDNQIVFKRKDGHFKAFCKEVAKDENYVFIIDEINRGEISKIFGEIFSLIEKDYRGEDNKIATQYQGLIDDGNDIFKDGFYVPDNVYIIGTMNDIDKGVDSIDFAIRRRFIWKEVKAKDTQDSILNSKIDKLNEEMEKCNDEKRKQENKEKIKKYKDCLPEIKKRMDALNEVIEKDQELGTDYQIGAAYFKNITIDDNGPNYDELWETALEPLLKEYLRGRGNADIKKFKEAYEQKKSNNNKKEKDKSQSNVWNDTSSDEEDSDNYNDE